MNTRTLSVLEASKLSTNELIKLRKDELIILMAKIELYIELINNFDLVPKGDEQ